MEKESIFAVMKAFRPKEIICLEVIPVNTEEDGMVFFVIAVDMFSKFAFNLGIYRDDSDATFLNCIRLLLQDKEFKKHHGPYMLVLSGYEHIEKQISKLIAPDGRVLFDKDLVYEEIAPVIDSMFNQGH